MWAYDEAQHEYHMLPVAIKRATELHLFIHSVSSLVGTTGTVVFDSNNLRWSEMFGKGVLLVLLVLGAIAFQAQARPCQ